MDIITAQNLPASLRDNELVDLWVAGANARAVRVASCLLDSDDNGVLAEARLVLVGAVKRWSEAGSGAVQQQTAGPYSLGVDTRQRGGFNLWPSEIEQLQALCADSGKRREAYAVDMIPAAANLTGHAAICALVFGADYCSCEASLTNNEYPLYEV